MRRFQMTAVPLKRELAEERFVKGHDFSHANKPSRMNRALQAAKTPIGQRFVKGHDFSRANKQEEETWALAPEVRIQPTSRHALHLPGTRFACILLFLVAACRLYPQSNPLVDIGHVTVDGRDVPYRIRNLPINAFPDLPGPIAVALDARGCVIPQTYQAKRPENVIHGSFKRSGSDDWAVLCSSKGVVSLLVFFSDGKVDEPEVVASAKLTSRAQAHDSSGELGFNWGIDTATPKQVHEAQAGMAHRPSPPTYDCVADTTLGWNTHYRMFWHGAWGQVDTGVD